MSRSGQVEASPEGNRPFRLRPTKEGDHEPSNSGTQSWYRIPSGCLMSPLIYRGCLVNDGIPLPHSTPRKQVCNAHQFTVNE